MRRSWGIFANPWLDRATPLKRFPCTQHQEAHKAVYFPTFNTGWRQECRKPRGCFGEILEHCAKPNRLWLYQGVFCFHTI